MTPLVEIKQFIKSTYIRYEMWITPLWKFLLSFITLLVINKNVGYLALLKPLPITLMLALLCSFMPVNFMVFVMAFVILGHLYAVSIETLIVSLVIFLLMFLLYFRFGPGDTVVLIVTPLLFLMHIPYLMPLALGLIASPLSIAAMSCGVVVYYLLTYVQANATTMGASSVLGGEDTEIIVQLRTFLTGFLTNRAMWAMIAAFAVVVVVVYLIRRLSVDHAWKIAIIAGAVVNVVTLMLGDFLYDTKISFAGVVVGTLVSALLCFILEFFFFQLDYSRTERVQFEDDEYYYYVKAVPKVTLAEPEKHVKKINRAHSQQSSHASTHKPQRSSPSKGSPRSLDDDDDIREDIPVKTVSRPDGVSRPTSRTTTARMPSGRSSSSAQKAPVRRTVSTADRRPAASTRDITMKSSDADGMRERVLRVGNDRTSGTAARSQSSASARTPGGSGTGRSE